MEMNFCRRCGSKLTHINKHVYRCENEHTLFANANPSTCVWLLNDSNEVLITKRGIEPGKGAYDAAGGFVDGSFETADEAVVRELQEELGLEPNDYSKPFCIASTIGQYEHEGEKIPTLDLIYWARLNGNVTITPKDDVAAYEFLPINQVDPDKIYIKAVREGFLELCRQKG
jgi:ADP-ribose pyrophosphatase YjhB (NUDIX family)